MEKVLSVVGMSFLVIGMAHYKFGFFGALVATIIIGGVIYWLKNYKIPNPKCPQCGSENLEIVVTEVDRGMGTKKIRHNGHEHIASVTIIKRRWDYKCNDCNHTYVQYVSSSL